MEPTTRTPEQLLATVASLGPELESGAAAAEELRTLPPTTVARLRSEHLFWLKTPSELGGTPVDPLTFSALVETLAYYDASAAWTVMIGNGATGMVAGWLPDEGVADVFADRRALPIVAGQAMARNGTGAAVDGGVVVSGRFSFSSGVHHADWLLAACTVSPPAGRRPAALGLVVPRAAAVVHDSWFAAGLQGSGSADFSLEDVFVPDHRTYEHPISSGPAPGRRGGALFLQPQRLLTANEVPPFCLGVARRALDDVVAAATGLLRGPGGTLLSERATFQREVTLAGTRVRAAKLVYEEAIGAAWEHASAGEACPEEEFLAAMVAQAFVADTCVEVVVNLFRYGGGRFLSLSHPMQRHVRNLLAARQHIAASDESYELAGRLRIDAARPG